MLNVMAKTLFNNLQFYIGRPVNTGLTQKLVTNTLLLWALLILLPFSVQAATLTSTVDRTTIPMNETFTLHVTYDGDADDQEIDTTLLQQQFKIAGRNKTSSIQVINGNASRNTTWYFELAARKTGTALIPSFSINDTYSEAITITVTDVPRAVANTNQSIYSEVVVDKRTVHVQEQVVVTWRLVSSLPISDPAMDAPGIDNVLVHDLGSRQYQRSSANGTVEMVIEQRYAFFPQQSGVAVIPPQQFEFRINTTRRFRTGIVANTQEKRRVSTEPQTITVLPAETGTGTTVANQQWLPALGMEIVQDFTGLQQQGTATVGEAFTRVISIRASGLTAEQLPAPALEVNGFKTYSDKPEFTNHNNDKGVYGIRTERVTMIPAKDGTLTLPAIQIPWYNTATGQWENAQLAARTIVVLPASNNAAATATTAGNQSPDNPLPDDNHSDREHTQGATPAQEQPGAASKLYGFSTLTLGLIAALLLALVLALAKLLMMQRKMQALLANGSLPTTAARLSPAETAKATADSLAHAITSGDVPAFYKAVLQWGRQHWASNPPHSLADMAARLDDVILREQLLALDACLYGGQSSLPSLSDIGTGLQQYAASTKPASAKPSSADKPQLEDLYRN